MVHQYKLNGYNIVLDTASGSVHTVDEVAYDIIEMYVRLARIIKRDGIPRDAAERRINAQRDDAFFRKACQYILENDSDEAALEAQVRALLEHSGVGLA